MSLLARTIFFLLAMVVLSVATPRMALSLPSVQMVSDSEDDATVSLSVLQEGIVGDVVSWCELRVQVAGVEVALTAGDTVSASVYEDDLVTDDLVWASSFTVTAGEAGSGLVDRTLDCSATVDDDGGQPISEVYAELLVDKAECGVFCNADSPRTTNAQIQWLADDGLEDDDTINESVPVFPGVTADRISNDAADWISFDLADASKRGSAPRIRPSQAARRP